MGFGAPAPPLPTRRSPLRGSLAARLASTEGAGADGADADGAGCGAAGCGIGTGAGAA